MKSYIKTLIPATCFMLGLGMTSCVGDLDVEPIDERTDMTVDPIGLYNKCFANMGQEGNAGANGSSDIDGIDGGTSAFVRQIWNAQELTTDEAHCPWGDEGIPAFNHNQWGASHPMLRGLYYRLYNGVTLCNHYLEVASDYDAQMTAEVRYARALYYYYLIDGWGDVGFTTVAAGKAPEQQSRATTWQWIMDELNDIEGQLSEAKPKTDGGVFTGGKSTGYGRPDKAAVWMLRTRMYLNAEVYIGKPMWAEAKAEAKKIIDSAYKLNTQETKNGWTAYQQLFMGDNGSNGASVEAILPIMQDGKMCTAWGCTMFLIGGTYKDDMIDGQFAAGNGTTENWQGNRARRDLVQKFFPNLDAPNVSTADMQAAAGDDRALFWGIDRTIDITNESKFEEGFSVTKFCNYYSDGSAAHSSQFPDTDFFLMRAAEAYLAFGEADARLNNNAASAEGIQVLNQIRQRAHAATKANWTLSEIENEWSREFYFEGLRRTTLIRFGHFGGQNGYNWAWKGGVANGANFDAHLNVFAFPNTDIAVNPNLKQNAGY